MIKSPNPWSSLKCWSFRNTLRLTERAFDFFFGLPSSYLRSFVLIINSRKYIFTFTRAGEMLHCRAWMSLEQRSGLRWTIRRVYLNTKNVNLICFFFFLGRRFEVFVLEICKHYRNCVTSLLFSFCPWAVVWSTGWPAADPAAYGTCSADRPTNELRWCRPGIPGGYNSNRVLQIL